MIRKATIKDVKVIYDLLQIYGKQGELLPRPLTELYDHLRDFLVYDEGQKKGVVGCCALQFCWEDLAEIRSLAVHPDYTSQNFGSELVNRSLAEANDYDITRVFTLTYRPSFFKRFGFSRVDRSQLPLKIWGGCLNCVKFPDCDEIAMVKSLAAAKDKGQGPLILGHGLP